MNEKKVREAIELIKSKIRILEKLENYGSAIEEKKKKHIELYNTAIEALEKQLPKKPTLEGDGYDPEGNIILDEWLRPNCNTRYEVDYDRYFYCPNCGQKIKWSEEDE